VRFVEEQTGRVKEFDFSRFPLASAMCQWLARAFARRSGPRSGIKRVRTANDLFCTLGAFARFLAETGKSISAPEDLSVGDIAAFRLRHVGTPGGAHKVVKLRSALWQDPELPETVRNALLARRPRLPENVRQTAYSDHEWQLIMTAVRSDIRRARDRVRAGRQLLADYRAGSLATDNKRARLASLLDVLDRTGDIPRGCRGRVAGRVNRAGGARAITTMLCLTAGEATAFCLLLCALTGENFSTVASWPATSFQPAGRPDAHGLPQVALVEQVKPRRGPERAHMVAALEDMPAWPSTPTEAGDSERGQLRSPVAVYRLLVELTETSRRLGGHQSAFSSYRTTRCRVGTAWAEGVSGSDLWAWARGHQFPPLAESAKTGRPSIDVRRVRQTVIEHRRWPVSHTHETMNDHYLATSSNVMADSRVVVGDALRDEVGKARRRQLAQVYTSSFVAEADSDIRTAAGRVGLAPGLLAGLVRGDHDTVLAACTDHHGFPGGDAGELCTASFLACLDCPNARALPSHLPAQIAMADRLAQLASHLDPQVFKARYEPRLSQLRQIIAQHTTAEQAKAAGAVTAEQLALVDDVLAGRWDLR
jgi:hypothetical protein